MFFSGDHAIAIARTNDLSATDAYDATNPNFWSIDQNPIIPYTEHVENTSIDYEPSNGYYFLFTNYIKDSSYTDACWVYWTKDVENWDENNKAVVMDGTTSTWAHGAIGMPTVVKKDDKTLHWFMMENQEPIMYI